MRGSFEFEWCAVDQKGNSRARDVEPHHRATLERTASRVVADRLADGIIEEKMHEVVFENPDESDGGTAYEGYWRVVVQE